MPPVDGPKKKQRVLQKIPAHVIREAKGLAIFTTMRTGLWISGAGGSGILIAKKEDGTWSPPSGIMLHTAGLGFLVGVDIYDCVVVINTQRALDAFTKVRCTLGGEVSAVAGPVGAGALLETSVHKHQAPVYTYLKSRGFYAGVQIDGTVVIERMDENERFYGQKLPVADILAGKVRHAPYEVRRLLETIKAAQGDSDVDDFLLPTEAPPADYEIDDGQAFGVPKLDDPDPYGVLALEKEGMSLKEAGTQKRASWAEFSFNPSPTSPIYNVYRQSQELGARSASRRNSWRSSAFSMDPKTPSSLRGSLDQRRSSVIMTDTSTQTDLLPDGPVSPGRRIIGGHSQHSSKGSFTNGHSSFMQGVPEHEVLKTPQEQIGSTNISTANGYSTPPHTPPGIYDTPEDLPERDDDQFDDVQIVEQPVLQSLQTVQPTASKVLSKARLVNVPKRVAPKLPPRNPGRNLPVVVGATPVSRTPSPTKSAASATSPAEEVSMAVEPDLTKSQATSTALQGMDATPTSPMAESSGASPSASKLQNIHLKEEDDVSHHLRPSTSLEKSERTAEPVVEVKEKESEKEKEKMPGGFD